MEKKNLYTLPQASEVLHISLAQLKKLIKEKKIKETNIEKDSYVRYSDLSQYLKGHPIEAEKPKVQKAATKKKVKKKVIKKLVQ